jgi:hypothetical protein
MKHVGFFIPTYGEIIEFFASMNAGFFTMALIGFCFGFGIRRFLDKSALNEFLSGSFRPRGQDGAGY